MSSYRLTAASAFLLLTVCVGQAGSGVEAVIDLQLVHRILGSAQVPGSLAYSSCGFRKRAPAPDDLPAMRVLPDYSGPPKEVLQKIFADDSRMRVTQDEGGTIRMMETDVPRDLLDVKISHIAFDLSGRAAKMLGGTNGALVLILSTPEVKTFRKAHNIEPFPDAWKGPSDGSNSRRVSGDLHNVTVSEGLDYVLQTFPGFWVYENCGSEEGERSVYFNFH
jgi:hypothetical protein